MKHTFTLAIVVLISICFCVAPLSAADIGGSIASNTTLTIDNSPYNVTSNVTVEPGITLTIESGVEIRFGANLYIHVRGIMDANGVVFTADSDTPTAGYYDGIYAGYQGYAEFGEVNLDGCTIEHAKQLYARKGSLNLNNCTLNNFSGYGVDIYQNGTLNIENTSISNTSYPIYFRDTNGGNFTAGSNVTLTGNTNDFIFIDFRDLDEVFNMPDVGIPYYYNSELRILETGQLNIEPGAELHGNTSAYISVNGIIKANGTEVSPVVFTTRTGNTYWRGINVNNTSNDSECIFNNCILENANYDNRSYSSLAIIDASPVIDSCIFRNNIYNLEIHGRSLPEFSNNSFGASTRVYNYPFNISLDLNAEPTFDGDTIHFNNSEARAIGVIGNTVVNDSHLRKIDFVGIDNITYLLTADVTIDPVGSLTIDPGIVIKCNQHDWDIHANGTLTGIGTELEPIVFTHQADDTQGNPADTYNNGAGSPLNNSSSGRIALNSSELSTLDNWLIKYAGYSSSYYGVYVRNNNIVRNSHIMNSYRAVYFAESAQVINNNFENISYYPVSRYLNEGTPILISNTTNNVTCGGIHLIDFATDTVTLAPMDFAGNTNVAYVIEGTKTIPTNAIVNVAPGTVIKFNGWAHLYINGGISAQGTEAEKIVFTSYYDDSAAGDTNVNGTANAPGAGNWSGITFNAGSLDNINELIHCDIRYLYYGLNMSSCFVDIQSMLMNFSSLNGLVIYGDANPSVVNSNFYNLGRAPVHMDMFADPSFSNNAVANVPRLSISLRGQILSGTVPVRSFAGVDSITYEMNEHITVNDHLIIPAGLTFKSNGDVRWYVNGRLDVQGTAEKPVVFTSYQDDAYGHPKDLEMNGLSTQYNRGSHIYFYDGSDDNSVVSNAIFRYSYTNAIKCYNSSPTIENSLFENYAQQGVYLSGLSNPTVNNCTFNNIAYPLAISLSSFPSNHLGNVISGTTGRGIRIIDETQTQDVTVNKHDFAGITNIPYILGTYTIGTGSVVTIDPGVVFKFVPNGSLRIYNGLKAIGNASEKIVFTASTDDFYGGDTYNDGDSNLPSRTHWYGIYFYNEAIDANCEMDYCIVKHGSYNAGGNSWGGVSVDNSSPTINNTLFDSNQFGIVSRNTSNPSISNCDFINLHPSQGYAVYNITSANVIDVPNSWWGDATGPYHATLNPAGLGKAVSDGVTFTPWTSILGSPVIGDVSLNGEIKPYDASLILQHSVGNITLTAQQQAVADVSGDASISAYDASLVLQYSIGLITNFNDVPPPLAMLKSTGLGADLIIQGSDVYPSQKTFTVPIQLTSSENIKAIDLNLDINSSHLKLIGVESDDIETGVLLANGYNAATGVISISIASAHNLNLSQSLLNLKFEIVDSNISSSVIELTKASANENMVDTTFDIDVISPITTNLEDVDNEPLKIFFAQQQLQIEVATGVTLPQSTILITDLSGKILHQIITDELYNGIHSFNIPAISNGGSAILLISITNQDFSITKKVSIN